MNLKNLLLWRQILAKENPQQDNARWGINESRANVRQERLLFWNERRASEAPRHALASRP